MENNSGQVLRYFQYFQHREFYKIDSFTLIQREMTQSQSIIYNNFIVIVIQEIFCHYLQLHTMSRFGRTMSNTFLNYQKRSSDRAIITNIRVLGERKIAGGNNRCIDNNNNQYKQFSNDR